MCQTADAHAAGDFRASNLNTLIGMVAGGLGMTLLPAMAVNAEPALTDTVGVMPMPKDTPGRTIGLAWRSTSPRRPDFEAFGKVVQANRPE